jgi:hypothetical protein
VAAALGLLRLLVKNQRKLLSMNTLHFNRVISNHGPTNQIKPNQSTFSPALSSPPSNPATRGAAANIPRARARGIIESAIRNLQSAIRNFPTPLLTPSAPPHKVTPLSAQLN